METILSNALYFRGVERLLILVAAVFSIYLGYKLFRHGVNEVQSGEWKSSSFSFKLTRVSPGSFFALLGTFVLVWGLLGELKIGNVNSAQTTSSESDIKPDEIENHGQQEASPPLLTLSYFGKAPTNVTIKTFNTLVDILKDHSFEGLPSVQIDALNESIYHIKEMRKQLLIQKFGVENHKILIKYNKDFLDGNEIPEKYIDILTDINNLLNDNFVSP